MEQSQHISNNNKNTKFQIRNFETLEDVNFASKLTSGEKWHAEIETEIKALFENNPEGCFIAEINGEPVGICIATNYAQAGFIGDLIVSPNRRNMGIGKSLMENAINYLKANNTQNIFLDGVRKAVPLYQKMGFQHLCRSLRFFGQVSPRDSNNVSLITRTDLPEIIELDQQVFGSDRSFFLERRLRNYPDLCLKLLHQNRIQAYLFARSGTGGWITLGPWISFIPPSESMVLLNSFQHQIGNQPFALGLLETNKPVIQLLIQEGLMPDPDSSYRMRLGNQFNPGDDPRCFAIGSPAKG